MYGSRPEEYWLKGQCELLSLSNTLLDLPEWEKFLFLCLLFCYCQICKLAKFKFSWTYLNEALGKKLDFRNKVPHRLSYKTFY